MRWQPGPCLRRLGETRRAIQFYEQQLAIVREIGDRRGEGNALGNLGNLPTPTWARPAAPSSSMNKQLLIDREIGDRRGEGNALGNLGLAYADLGETRRAIQFYEQALLIDREIGDRRGEGNDLWNMSLALDQLGERAQAIQHAEQALTHLRADRRSQRRESARATCRLARANKHVKLTSSLNPNGNLIASQSQALCACTQILRLFANVFQRDNDQG
jgi:tetratricopeptide (TPR) repeat protein